MIRRHVIAILIRPEGDGSPGGVDWMGTWRTLHPRRILHATGAISVHGGVLLGESRTRALRSEAEFSANRALI